MYKIPNDALGFSPPHHHYQHHQTISFISSSNILIKPDTLVGSAVVEVVAVVEVADVVDVVVPWRKRKRTRLDATSIRR